jgi:hypothetical protein
VILRRAEATGAAVLVALLLGGCGGGAEPDLGPDDSAPSPVEAAAGSTTVAPGAAPTTAPPTTTTSLPGGDVEVSSDLPEDWPDDLPVPGDAVLELSQRTEQEDGSVLLTADFTVDDGGANVYTAFLAGLEGEGTTVLQRSSGGTDDGFVGSISFSRADYEGNVAVDEVTGSTVLSVSVVLPA